MKILSRKKVSVALRLRYFGVPFLYTILKSSFHPSISFQTTLFGFCIIKVQPKYFITHKILFSADITEQKGFSFNNKSGKEIRLCDLRPTHKGQLTIHKSLQTITSFLGLWGIFE